MLYGNFTCTVKGTYDELISMNAHVARMVRQQKSELEKTDNSHQIENEYENRMVLNGKPLTTQMDSEDCENHYYENHFVQKTSKYKRNESEPSVPDTTLLLAIRPSSLQQSNNSQTQSNSRKVRVISSPPPSYPQHQNWAFPSYNRYSSRVLLSPPPATCQNTVERALSMRYSTAHLPSNRKLPISPLDGWMQESPQDGHRVMDVDVEGTSESASRVGQVPLNGSTEKAQVGAYSTLILHKPLIRLNSIHEKIGV